MTDGDIVHVSTGLQSQPCIACLAAYFALKQSVPSLPRNHTVQYQEHHRSWEHRHHAWGVKHLFGPPKRISLTFITCTTPKIDSVHPARYTQAMPIIWTIEAQLIYSQQRSQKKKAEPTNNANLMFGGCKRWPRAAIFRLQKIVHHSGSKPHAWSNWYLVGWYQFDWEHAQKGTFYLLKDTPKLTWYPINTIHLEHPRALMRSSYIVLSLGVKQTALRRCAHCKFQKSTTSS